MNWESVFDDVDNYDRLDRIKVAGGWIYRSIVTNRMAMVFVPNGAVEQEDASLKSQEYQRQFDQDQAQRDLRRAMVERGTQVLNP